MVTGLVGGGIGCRLGFIQTFSLPSRHTPLFSIPSLSLPARCVSRTSKLTADNNNDGLATLVVLRHGQSTWNANPTFTGWCDAPLTDRGIAEAKASGKLLKERGFANFDMAYTSTLERAVITCELALQHAESTNTALEKAWQLNERHYGALQGFQKDDPSLPKKYGADLLRSWRRDFNSTPPAMDESHPHYRVPPAPLTESLADCQERVLKYWKETILPSLKPNTTVLLAAHSNTLRALVSYLDRVPLEKIPNLHIPNSVPCVYQIDPNNNGEVVSPKTDSAAGGTRGRWMLNSENHSRLRKEVGGTGTFARSLFDAWDLNGDGVLDRYEIELGLKDLMGGDDIAVGAIAGKILQEIDEDGNETLDLVEFETYALDACRKFMPGLLEEE